MCNPVQSILDAIADNIVKTVFKSVGRHVGFLFHYKQNLKDLEDEKNNLQQQRCNVQEKVNEAQHRGEAVDDNVSVWLKDVEETSQGVGTFMDERKENMMCFNFSCPDFISRYRLSKQAEKKVVDIKHLAEKGNKIGTVSHPREDPPELELPSSKNYEDFRSRHEVFEGIVQALKHPEVNMIGVYGTGGVGKTTMVEKVGKQLKKDGTFDEVIMAVVSQDANVKKIQGQLADNLDLTLGGETEVRRAKELWKRLDNGKKNLIILDDVWHELDLKEIGIPIEDGNKRCKVVLTSRNRDVWKNMEVHEDFHVKFLSEEEAWILFKKKVGNHVDSHDQPLRDIAWAVCKECQGLPVAINAIGAALNGKDMHAWKDALHKLKNSMLKDIVGIDPKVYASLKLSYDLLESEDAKSCFLLCCLFTEDAEISIDDLVRYYMAWRTLHRYQMQVTLEKALDRICTVVSTLKSCCLLLDGKGKHLVKMHDVVRDVAISIAEDEKSFLVQHGFTNWPEKIAYGHCSVISLRPNNVRKCPDELVCPELHTLRLDCTTIGYLPQVPDEFFSGTGKLMVLDLERVIMSPVLPASLAKLAKLQMLCLNRCILEDIAILKDLKDHLEILSLRGSDIKVLPPEVGELTRLRLLDMSNCRWLEMIPKGVISKLVLLEELYMPFSFDQWEGRRAEGEVSNIVSLDELVSLTRLTTLQIWIPDTTLLPKDLTFENQVRFRIKFGQDGIDYTHTDLRVMVSYGTKASTGVLKLENFHSANTLEFLVGKPKWSIQRNGLYPSIFVNHLTDLSVTNCGLKYLFSPLCARGLVRLQYLAIRNCRVMEGVIGTEGDKDEDIPIIFSGLKLLHLRALPNLISFYPQKEKASTSSGSSSGLAQMVLFNDKATFPSLKSLEINSVDKITEIWDRQMLPIQEIAAESSLRELVNLEIGFCKKLVNVVGGCPKLEAIVTEKQKGKEDDYHVTCFPKLKILELRVLQNLESFCSHSVRCKAQVPLFDHQLVAFPTLEKLNIVHLPNITDIWDKKLRPAESFCLLSDLRVFGCDKLINVVRSNMLPQLRNLKNLSLDGCQMIEVVADLEKEEEETQEPANKPIVPFPELTVMVLQNLQNIKGFCIFRSGEQLVFNVQVAFPKLEYLRLYKLGEIALQQLLGICDLSLKVYLDISRCDGVSTMFLPHSLRSLRNVGLLWVEYCKGVREIFHIDGVVVGDGQGCAGPSLIQVRMVQLEELPQLTCLWNKDPRVLLDLQNLEYLTIKDCPLLENLSTASVAKGLCGLKVLYLSSCSTMEEVITTDKEEHKDVIDDDHEIVFPKLERLILVDLPNLKSFCSSNHNLNFPSLRRVVLMRCPKMLTFTSGSVRMSQILLTTSENDGLVIEDLNKHLQKQHLKGDQEIIWATSDMHGDDELYSRLQISFEGVEGVGTSGVR